MLHKRDSKISRNFNINLTFKIIGDFKDLYPFFPQPNVKNYDKPRNLFSYNIYMIVDIEVIKKIYKISMPKII